MADDLFAWMDALYSKTRLDGTPPMYMIHRFLASDQACASAARYLQLQVRDADLLFRVWQGLLPKGKAAPRFSYSAPKKAPAAEELVLRIMAVEHERRAVAEQILELLHLAGKLDEAYQYYGVEKKEE